MVAHFHPSRLVYQSMNLPFEAVKAAPPPLCALIPLTPVALWPCIAVSKSVSEANRGSRDDSYSLLFSLRLCCMCFSALSVQWAVYTVFTFYILAKHIKPCQFRNDAFASEHFARFANENEREILWDFLINLVNSREFGYTRHKCMHILMKRSSEN